MTTKQSELKHPGLPERVHFVSLGCPKNLVDSEIMLGSLTQAGVGVTDEPSEADTIVINTCGFIEEAKRESVQKILEMAEHKKDGKLQRLVVAGCLTQRYKEELVKELPEADLFIGSGEFQNIAQILSRPSDGEKRFFNLPTYLQQPSTPRVNSQARHRAYLKISEGCMKRCAFCAIPHIRGDLQSRSLDPIVSEARLLAAGGVRELNIISHDFTDFGRDLKRRDKSARESPVSLLRELSEVEGLDWIRVLYLYPDGVTPELISLIKSRTNLVKYFDMPLQHINNEMLKRMNRRMTREKIIEVLDNIRAEIPGAVIRTQFIVGFPGETDESFDELMEFIAEQRFDRVGCFEYSPEEGTKGFSLPNPVDEATKRRRYEELMSLQMEISREKHRELVGQTLPVIVEGVSEESEWLLQGRTSQQAPDIDGIVYINEGTAEIGDLVPVEITDSLDYDLVGGIVHSVIDESERPNSLKPLGFAD